MKKKTVTFATSCWERDWKDILKRPNYLQIHQIEHHHFPFDEKILIINNVLNLEEVCLEAQKKVDEKILTRFVVAKEKNLEPFQLKRSDFRVGEDASLYVGVNPDWIYYNALSPLTAILEAKTDYLLYVTGDVYLEKKCSWIHAAIAFMEKNPNIKVANLTWNQKYQEARRESYRKTLRFFVSKEGFSDQMFLIKTADFQQPIYREIREDSHHFPRGDVFEKRVFSYMKNRGWERITYRWGSYIHPNLSQ